MNFSCLANFSLYFRKKQCTFGHFHAIIAQQTGSGARQSRFQTSCKIMKVRHSYADCSFCHRRALRRFLPALSGRWPRNLPRGWQLPALRVQRVHALQAVSVRLNRYIAKFLGDGTCLRGILHCSVIRYTASMQALTSVSKIESSM